MYKISHFKGYNPKTGESLVRVVRPGETYLEKFAAMHPEIKRFASRLKPNKKHVYVIVGALGADEFWGSNINGDAFPEGGLIHEGKDYGLKTFLDGHVYKHHKNKNPGVSFGEIVLSIWNDKMKRVELVLKLDRDLAAKFDATDIIDKIDAGIPCDVSMGCKVPYDVCSICSNKSKTRDDYCIHLQNEMNKIYADGRKVRAFNLFPRFFDLSFVFIGADKIGKSLFKLASKGCCPVCEATGNKCSVDVAAEAGWVDDGQEKTAAIKQSAHRKLSEIFKDIPSHFLRKAVPALTDAEPDLPRTTLDRMGSRGSLGAALSTPSLMGMILKPHEYQRIILIRLGRRDVADDMDQEKLIFPSTEQADTSVPFEGIDPKLCECLMPFLARRSGFGPILKKRIIRISVVRPRPAEPREILKEGFLQKISAGYNGYRQQVLEQVPYRLSEALETSEKLASALFQERFLEMFVKEAQASVTGVSGIQPLLGTYPVLYLLAAHWRDQELHGQKLSYMQKYVASNPGLSSLLAAGAATQFMKGRSRVLAR